VLHEDILIINQKPFFIVVELLSLPSQKDGCNSMHGDLSFCRTLFLAWSCALELRKQGAQHGYPNDELCRQPNHSTCQC